MARYLISFDDGAMDHLGDDLAEVGEAAHRVLRAAKDAGVWVTGGGLQSQQASIVDTDGSVRAGDVPEVKAVLGGFSILDLDSHEEALAWAARFAEACRCAQEVRVIMDDPEVDNPVTVDAAVHRALAVEANNSTWEHLGRPADELTADEREEMTRRAFAAAYHWQRAEGSTPANAARADWLLSRVWVVQGEGERALHHARRCMAVCEEAGLVDFDLAYAHEATARALACMGDGAAARQHLVAARAVPIADAEDAQVVTTDLAAGPWFVLDVGAA